MCEPGVDPHPVAPGHLKPAATELDSAAAFSPSKGQTRSRGNDGPMGDIAQVSTDHHPAVAVCRRAIMPTRRQSLEACNRGAVVVKMHPVDLNDVNGDAEQAVLSQQIACHSH